MWSPSCPKWYLSGVQVLPMLVPKCCPAVSIFFLSGWRRWRAQGGQGEATVTRSRKDCLIVFYDLILLQPIFHSDFDDLVILWNKCWKKKKIEQMGQNFQICLRSGPMGLTPPPYGQPDCKIYVFYESPKHSPKLPFSFNCITLGKKYFLESTRGCRAAASTFLSFIRL